MAKPNPEIIKWARESSGLSLDEAAKKLSLKSSKQSGASILADYESGIKEPTSKKIGDIAKLYHRPLLTFYLAKPPVIQKKGEDYRTVPDSIPLEANGNVDAIVRDIFVRQSIVREALIDSDDAETKDFVGYLSNMPNIAEAVAYISKRFNISATEFRKQGTAHDAMGYLRKQVENEGIFILLIGNLGSHHSSVSTNYFRGFALADKIAPFIVINDNDSKAAWSFTLLHELAHILIGESGISNTSVAHKVEKYCNDIASNILLPEEDLSTVKIDDASNFEEFSSTLQERALFYNVSPSLIAYRLLRNGRVSHKQWEEISSHFKELWVQSKVKKQDEKKSSGTFYVTKRHKTGGALLRVVRNSILEGVITETKAGKVLGVSPGNVARMVGL
ncbi:ImmA/IrrE family metallo-endopeptidase [Pantoea agglomerans]|uniref:ImmA/IrrE family metallo-endopeptidase n=1 Tax=Enterobacter agglomerans TaxID=549 RepID=UPI000255412D|nr:XRE family transcriptional regulator [Pantoea agglomerans]